MSRGCTPSRRGAYITLSDLRAGGGMLYYGSIASGKDEVHGYDLVARREFRLSVSEYGSFDPAPAGRELLMTTYDRLGYRITHQPSDSLRIPVAHASLPVDLVNPPRRAGRSPTSIRCASQRRKLPCSGSISGRSVTGRCPTW